MNMPAIRISEILHNIFFLLLYAEKADTFCVDFLAEVISFISGSSIFYLGRTSFPERYVTSILKEFQYFLVLYAPLYTIIVKIQVTS